MTVPENPDKDVWVKVKLKINSDVKASWCRVMPGRGVRFYDIEGQLINQAENRVAVVEPCLESNVTHPIPSDEIDNIMDGYLSESWTCYRNPFGSKP